MARAKDATRAVFRANPAAAAAYDAQHAVLLERRAVLSGVLQAVAAEAAVVEALREVVPQEVALAVAFEAEAGAGAEAGTRGAAPLPPALVRMADVLGGWGARLGAEQDALTRVLGAVTPGPAAAR